MSPHDKRGEGAAPPPAFKKDWRFYAGLVAMAAAIILPLAAIFAFVASVFLMGAEFWEKARRIFMYEGKSNAPFTPPALLAGPAG